MYERSLGKGVEIVDLATVDSAQGKEWDFVIIDIVSIGGQFGLGFLTDPRRVCAALSRARIGLIIIGDKGMAHVQHPSAGVKMWADLLRKADARGLLIGTTSETDRVNQLMIRHDIERDYKRKAQR